MNSKQKKKIRIASAGVDKYLKNPRFSIASLAEELQMDAGEIYDLFPNRRQLLLYYYEDCMRQVRESTTAIPDYASFSLAEKLSHVALTLIDLFNDKRAFVALTYKEMIACKRTRTTFAKEAIAEIESILTSDQKQSAISSFLSSQTVTTKIFYTHLHGLIAFWLKDESENDQKTMELVDKWCAFVQEAAYSSIIDRGFELAKFAYQQLPSCKSSPIHQRCRNHHE
ncbi:MAG: hypothetical protein ACNA78_10110 [Balneolaceae bacterium]